MNTPPLQPRRRKVKRKRKNNNRLTFLVSSVVTLVIIASAILILPNMVVDLPNNISSSVDNSSKSAPITTSKDKSSSHSSKYSKGTLPVSDWNLILVNSENYIPDNYKVKLVKLSNEEQVDERIHPELQAMFDAAREEKVYPIVVAGYRTEKVQKDLMDNKIKEYKKLGYSTANAKKYAKEWVAVAGTSEHELGLAVDINADGVNSKWQDVYDWLYKNSYKYGFIRRYPPDKTEITGIAHEPWHYRYVGIEVAIKMYNDGVCLEEYLDEIAQ